MTQAGAVREDQHPIIAAIDQRMPEIAGILPAGMDSGRFRKVVVQAMLRQPALWTCTPISIITAITEAAEVGIEPTGVLGKGWLIPYKGEAKFIPGWRGFVDLLWRADKILATVDVVRVGDSFSYQRGTDAFVHHVPDLTDPEREAADDNIIASYVVVTFPDGRQDFEVMSRAALDRIRDEAVRKAKDPKKSVWNLHPGEMMKKTPIRRIAKRMPLSPAVQAMLARDEEIDYDTAVERVPDPKREGLRDRISHRTAALRGDSSGESEGSTDGAVDGPPSVGFQPEGDAAGSPLPSGGSPARGGDPWMRRLHAVGAERGMDHAALHDWAVDHFRVESLSDLTPPQRATFMDLVERMEVAPTPADDVPTSALAEPGQGTVEGDGEGIPVPVTTPSSEAATSADRALLPPESDPPAAPTDAEILAAAGPGAEIVPPKPGTAEYRALPNGTERAKAKAYWDRARRGEPQA